MQHSCLIFSKNITNRLIYVLDYIFKERLGMDYLLTLNEVEFKNHEGVKFNYTAEKISEDEIQIIPEKLLYEDDVKTQSISINRWKHSFVLFYNQPKGIIPFDILAATFFLLSRYEEYLPFEKDGHGRFSSSQSITSQYSFLKQPVIDEWIVQLKIILQDQFGISFSKRKATAQVTYDVDMIWKYLFKSAKLQNLGKAKEILNLNLKQFRERIKVIKDKGKDPFDCFDELQNWDSIYFILANDLTKWDRNTHYEHPAYIEKVKQIASKNTVGIHPSYFSNENKIIQKEKERLEKIIEQPITKSRQHFIKLFLPQTYHQLINSSISDDYSMGYPDANGFRAGTSLPFKWFDVRANTKTDLTVHPFAYMDATTVFYNKHSKEEALIELSLLIDAIKKTDGHFISIWHNYLIGDQLSYPQHRHLYLEFMQMIRSSF